jgi:hypothetical protein
MKKLFGLALLALVFFAPDVAQAATRFAVCSTTCTWDNTSTAMWCATDTGCTGASAPVAGDDVTLNANTCVGGTTCTITTFAGTISIASLTMSACTASTSGCILEASTNNTNFTLTGSYTNTGSGTRTLNMGTGTWTFSGNASLWNIVASATLSAASSTIAFTSATPATRQLVGAGKTYGTITVSGGASSFFIPSGNNTIGTFTVSAPNKIQPAASSTQTITTFTNVTGTSSTPVLFGGANSFTISSANNWTCEWCGFVSGTYSGGGTFTGNSSLNFGGNSGITINPPSGGAASPRTIGG